MNATGRMLKSFSASNLFPSSPISQSDTVFFRINPVSKPNTEGKNPIIIYKKKKKMQSIFDLNLREMGYITDGGLKKKVQRFDGTRTLSKQGLSLICTPKQNAHFSNSAHLSRGPLCQSMKDIKPKKMSDLKTAGKFTPKSQKANCLDRKSLTMRSSKVNSPTVHRRCLSPEMKYEQMDELVKRAIASKFREFTGERIKKTREEEINERKHKYLEDNGVEIYLESLQNDSNANKDGVLLESNKNDEGYNSDLPSDQSKRLSKSNQFNISNSQFQSSLMNKDRFIRSGSYNNIYEEANRDRRVLKPRVDNLEYINKINDEAKQITNRIRNRSTQSANSKNNNSFRKSSSQGKHLHNLPLNSNQFETKAKHSALQSRILLSSNQSHPRSEEELAHFTLSKKIQKQEREQKEIIDNNKKLFLILTNLSTLSQKLQFKPKKSHIKKKQKIKNEFYMGKTASNYSNNKTNNNNSTIIDPDDFYCSVIEGQKLIVKSDCDFEIEKKKEQSSNSNRHSPINPNNINKEQIQKITKECSSHSTNNNQSTAQFSQLQQRAIKTILRTNDLLSHENIDGIFNSEKSLKEVNKVIKEKKTTARSITPPINEEKREEPEPDAIVINEEDKQYEDLNLNEDNDEVTSNLNSKSNKVKLVIEDEYTQSCNATKEKNLPSLSHTYTINNTITNNKRIIEPSAVLNLVEIIKILMQRKIFYMFYEDYFNEAMIQRYTIAFVYFNALLKQRTFHQLACYANYKLEYYALTQLFKPFIKRAFHSFVSQCNYIEKIKYLNELLVHIFKKKSIERIYVYGYVAQSVCDIFSKVLPRAALQKAFHHFEEKAREKKRKRDKVVKEKKEYNYEMLDERLQTVSSGHSAESDEKRYIKKKMNTYAYEASLRSEFSVEPNSVDSDRLHRLHIIFNQNEKMISDQYESREVAQGLQIKKRSRPRSEHNSLQNSNSSKSVKSLKDICQMKPGVDLSKSHESLEETIKRFSSKSLRRSSSNKSNEFSAEKKKDNKSREDNEAETLMSFKKKEEEKESDTKIEVKKNDNIVINSDEVRKEEGKGGMKGEVIKTSQKVILSIGSELDISAEKDVTGHIDWELPVNCFVTDKKKESEEKAKPVKEVLPADDIEEPIDLNKVSEQLHLEQLSPIKQQDNPLPDNNHLPNPLIPQSPPRKTDQYLESTPVIPPRESNKECSPQMKQHTNSSNNNSYINEFEKESISQIEDPETDNIVSLIQNETKQQECLSKININTLTDLILTQLLSELKESAIIPHKTLKFEVIPIQTNNSNSISSSGHLTHQSLSQLTESSYNSLMMNYTALSLFSKTTKDKKKQQSLSLYMTKIYPKLIHLIKEDIRANCSKIYNNLRTPIRSTPQGLMASLSLEDAEMLRDNYKRLQLTDEEFQMINKDKLLKDFEAVNRKIRLKDNVTSDNHYDKLLNECIIDTAIELLNQERLYGESGEPLPWSSRLREMDFRYPRNSPDKLIEFIERELFALINKKIGMISENFDYMEQDQLNNEREKRLLDNILNELNETEYQWINLEMEETQIKIEAHELIIEQLYHEVIEIIEHIQYSRKHPELYQHKSIYACEDIPKLACQITSEGNKEEEEENELMNR